MADQPTVPSVMTKRNVLVPVDDSVESENAVDWVLANFYRDGDEIHLFHVIATPMPEVIGGLGAMEGVVTIDPDPQLDQKHVDNARELCQRRFVPKLTAAGAAYKVEIVRFLTDNDSIGEAVCKRASAINAVAIVMASHNKGVFKEFFLGSVSKYAASHAKTAVVVLH